MPRNSNNITGSPGRTETPPAGDCEGLAVHAVEQPSHVHSWPRQRPSQSDPLQPAAFAAPERVLFFLDTGAFVQGDVDNYLERSAP